MRDVVLGEAPIRFVVLCVHALADLLTDCEVVALLAQT